jgi:hypothetical protein
MKKFLCFLIFLPLFGMAQSDSINLDAKLNFVSPIDVFNFPTIDLSLEQRITNRLSIVVEGGYEFYHFNSTDTSFIHPGGYKLRAEFRYYHPFVSRERRHTLRGSLTGFYIGKDIFYRQEQYNSAVQFTASNGDSTIYTDEYWTKKSAIGGNCTFGYQWSPLKRIVADAYLGIGVLHRTISRHELSFSEDEGEKIVSSTEVNSFFSAHDLSERNGWGLSFSLGIRLGFIIY